MFNRWKEDNTFLYDTNPHEYDYHICMTIVSHENSRHLRLQTYINCETMQVKSQISQTIFSKLLNIPTQY